MGILAKKANFAAKSFFYIMRRVVRIKAMQGLYGFFNNKEVNLLDVKQKSFNNLIQIPEFYNADANEKKGFQKLFPLFYDEAFAGELQVSELPENQKWLGILAKKAVVDWNNEIENEKKRIEKKAIQDIRNQIAVEVSFWQALLRLISMIEKEEERKQGNFINNSPSPESELKLLKHPFIPLLEKALHPGGSKNPKGFKTFDEDFFHRIYQNLFKELPEYQAYKEKKKTSPEEDEEIFRQLYRKLYKNTDFNETLAEADLHWSENRIFLEVKLKGTFKKLCAGEVPEFVPDTESEEEFISFFKILFFKSIENFEENEVLLQKAATNWDADRIALLDRWIIHLSLNEMKYFPHIPVKVTMNEYLEIAKAYSTPNSSGFINGVVDKLASLMKQEGSLKKSARGLMDNK